MNPEFEAVIGLEVHCQLSTQTKIFCGCSTQPVDLTQTTDFDAPAGKGVNVNTCAICAGHPGTLPILNQRVVEYAIRAGLSTNCQINQKNYFARKNYFYPDLPKGYQVTQHLEPICRDGWLVISTQEGEKKITIQRIHMEEDAGKNVHCDGFSMVDLNRAGVPLIEIVSGPDMRSAEEAGAYLRSLHSIVTYLGITDGNMQSGNFRCDANVSVMPRGSSVFGTRAEIKNVNSFRFVEKAIEFEIRRQIDVIQSGSRVVQETRTYDSVKDVTISMRSKEEAQDYRYFAEPDLTPYEIHSSWIDSIKASLPELPDQRRARLQGEYGLSSYDAHVLTSSKEWVEFYESIIKCLAEKGISASVGAKPAANFVTGELARLVNESGTEISSAQVKPAHIADLVQLVNTQILSSTNAKQALSLAWQTGKAIALIVEEEGLKQVSDLGFLDSAIQQVISDFPKQTAEFRSGKEKLLGFFVGQVMKKTQGKANPALLGELIHRKLTHPGE